MATFYGTVRADRIIGGDGNDTASYATSKVGVVVSLESGAGFGGLAQGDSLTSIENLTGSVHNDILTGDAGANVLNGLQGNDTLKGGGGADSLYGGADNDMLKGGSGADLLHGGSGNDTASYSGSGAGVNVSLHHDYASGGDAEGDELTSIENLTGSTHADDLRGNDLANVLNGNDGGDMLKGYGGAYTLNGGDGADSLYGMDGADTLDGGAGADILNGGAGADTMAGGTGNDEYYVDDNLDAITELDRQGYDTVYSSAVAYTLSENIETLSLDTDTDTGVYGTGNSQANSIRGNLNNNVLEGGGGGDSLTGLGGAASHDTFVFRPGDANGDIVQDFNGNSAAEGDYIFFIGYGTIAEGATLHQIDATHWEVTSADGTITDTITFNGAPGIDASDFIFV
jgi:Ca2+-binding RTX toxin-like protein